MVTFVIVLVVMGLVIGALARLIVPGRQSLSIVATMAIGIVGTLISGFIGRALFGADGRFGSWILALIVTIALIFGIQALQNRGSRGTTAGH